MKSRAILGQKYESNKRMLQKDVDNNDERAAGRLRQGTREGGAFFV